MLLMIIIRTSILTIICFWITSHEVSVVQLQARGPHVARHSVFSGPRKHSGKIFKSEIVQSVWVYIFLTGLLALDKVHLHKYNE